MDPEPPIIIVMGVSGTGKSTLSAAIASVLSLPVLDADDLHPPTNVAKMSQGIPLVDEDRYPWLDIIRSAGEEAVSHLIQSNDPHKGIVIACSALRKLYRNILRQSSKVNKHQLQLKPVFIHISGARKVLYERMSKRSNHFMKASMLDSQLATLEVPIDESDVVTVDLQSTTEEQVLVALEGMRRLGIQVIPRKPN